MKMVKSLLLGTAAGLVAVAGAQAADMPVKAAPVQYVKICTLYGDGFYYIPGTDTCLKMGGYIRVQAETHMPQPMHSMAPSMRRRSRLSPPTCANTAGTSSGTKAARRARATGSVGRSRPAAPEVRAQDLEGSGHGRCAS